MSTETDDKAQSKFPRASLRARNKTLMITPADVADYQLRSADESAVGAFDLGDVFDDSLDPIEDILQRDAEAQDNIPKLDSHDVEEDGELATLSDVWEESGEGFSKEGDLISASAVQVGGEAKSDDIFSIPAGDKLTPEEVFAAVPQAVRQDPILRETRIVQGFDHVIDPNPLVTNEGCCGKKVCVNDLPSKTALESASDEFHVSEPDYTSREYIEWKKPAKLVGFLISYAHDSMGKYIELREGRLLVSNSAHSADSCLVINHDSVSSMHAIMRISADGTILILDQLSEHGTRIKRADSDKEDQLMGDKTSITHGDVVIFGECEYHLVVIGSAALKREA